MKILWISCSPLFPLNRGGTIRSYNILRYLAESNNIMYLSYLDDSDLPESDIREKMKECAQRQIYHRKRWEKKFSPQFYLSLLQNLISKYPYVISKYDDRGMRKEVISLLKEERFDCIICDFLFASVLIPKEARSDCVLFQHNIESTIWERHYKEQRNPIKKLYLYNQWSRLLKYEKEICAQFKGCIVVSEIDAIKSREFGARSTHIISTGVDTEYFSPSGEKEKAYNIVFTGSMDWLPNEEAVIYFVNRVLPRVREKVPQATFSIVGRKPSKAVIGLAKKHPWVEVTGTVEDVRPYIERAWVYVVPIRIGGGTRLKIFEAMGMGKAVISTSIGAEGLDVNNGDNIILADTDDSFAGGVVELLLNKKKRNEIGRNAMEMVNNKYTNKIVAYEFEQICREFKEN